VVFRYCDADGRVTSDANPNGSVRNVAGVCNPAGNVVGLMPHPERASEEVLGSRDGRLLFESVITTVIARREAPKQSRLYEIATGLRPSQQGRSPRPFGARDD